MLQTLKIRKSAVSMRIGHPGNEDKSGQRFAAFSNEAHGHLLLTMSSSNNCGKCRNSKREVGISTTGRSSGLFDDALHVRILVSLQNMLLEAVQARPYLVRLGTSFKGTPIPLSRFLSHVNRSQVPRKVGTMQILATTFYQWRCIGFIWRLRVRH
jgi:hypothetical protein